MTDLIGNEEELNQLRQENQALREQANLLENRQMRTYEYYPNTGRI